MADFSDEEETNQNYYKNIKESGGPDMRIDTVETQQGNRGYPWKYARR